MKWKRISAKYFIAVLFIGCVEVHSAPLFDRLKFAGFNCIAKSNGHVCTSRANAAAGFRYPQPIAVLVPSGVQQPERILIYLHGIRGVCPAKNASLESLESDWSLLRQMIAGGAADSVILFPASEGSCATYDSSLVPRFKKFVEWGQNLLQPREQDIVFAGHSGAGARMASALAANPTVSKMTRAVFLLDATYGMSSAGSATLKKWREIARHNGQIRIWSRYLTGGSTEAGSQNLQRLLPSLVDSAVTVAGSHCRVPALEIQILLRKRIKSESDLNLVSF